MRIFHFCVLSLVGLVGCGSPRAIDISPSVKSDTLGKSVSVIGPLGQPLGKVILIEGKLVPQNERLDYWSANMAKNLFAVEKVDGKPLSRPFWIELVLPNSMGQLKGEYAKYEGYQTGGFVNVPDEAVAAFYDFPPQSNGWHFHVVFHVGDREHKEP